MRKHRITLVLVQVLASAIVMMAEANTRNIDFKKTEKDVAEEKDPEIEISQEKDVFPNLLTFATQFYQ